jgi:chaperonin GroEL
MLEDIAILTGGQLISEDLDQARERDHRDARARQEDHHREGKTTIVDGAGKKKDIEARVGQIKAQIKRPPRLRSRSCRSAKLAEASR